MFFAFSSLEQENYFLHQPETGMGYQVIEAAKVGAYERKKYIVLNSEIVIDYDLNYGENIKKIIGEGIQRAKISATKLTFSISSIKVLTENEFKGTVNEPFAKKRNGAVDEPIERASGTEIFTRLSAFEDDKRVDKVNNCLLPGSFSTTKKDYEICKLNNDDPIERYALPNAEIIKWAFFITPKSSDELQRGIVQPVNGKSGGGEEAYFINGTSKNTFSPPAQSY